MFVRPCAKRGGGGPSREARWWRGARFDAFTSGEGVSPRPKASIHFHRQHFVECPNPHHHLRSLRSLDGPLPARNAGGEDEERPTCFPGLPGRYKRPGGWRWTSHSPTGSGPEGSSPNERGSGRSSASHPAETFYRPMRRHFDGPPPYSSPLQGEERDRRPLAPSP